MNPILLAATLPWFQVENRWPTITTNSVIEETASGLRLGAVSIYQDPGGGAEFLKIYQWIVAQVVGIPEDRGRWLVHGNSYLHGEGTVLGPSSSEGGLFHNQFPFDGYMLSPVLARHGFRYEETPFEFRGPLAFPFPGNDLAGTRTNIFLGFKLFEDGDPTRSRFGWLELRRDGTDATFPFRIARSETDFVPNRPIEVGKEPEKPKVATRVVGDALELSWDALFTDAGFVLESTPSLESPVRWERVEVLKDPQHAVLPLSTGASGYFRLTLP